MMKVSVVLTTQERVEIPAEAIIGGFAIHPRLLGAVPTGPEWVVTHRTSGISVWIVTHYVAALKVAKALDDAGTIPEELEAFNKWVLNMTSNDRARLVEQLTSISPRAL